MPKVISDEQILDAVLDVIVQHGYAGATTREIAAAAGINEVTLFRRFGNKKNLLMAAVERKAEDFIAMGIDYTGDVEADLLRLVTFYNDLMTSHGRMIAMLMAEVPRQPELFEVMQTPLAIARKVNLLIAGYQEEGVLIEEPTMHTFMALVGPIYMAGIIWSIRPELLPSPLDPAEQVRGFLRGRAVSR